MCAAIPPEKFRATSGSGSEFSVAYTDKFVQGALPGVISTRCGYAGGKATKNVHYRNIQDHTETVAVEFDPDVVSYETLLKFFWTFHNPGSSSRSRQYMTACFTHGKEQAAAAAASYDAVRGALGKKPSTTIAPLTRFYVAEDYHQKYYLRTKHSDILPACGLHSDADILVSPLAAKLNSFVSGDGDAETLAALAEEYALPDAVVQRMSRRARSSPKPVPELPEGQGGSAAAGSGGGCACM